MNNKLVIFILALMVTMGLGCTRKPNDYLRPPSASASTPAQDTVPVEPTHIVSSDASFRIGKWSRVWVMPPGNHPTDTIHFLTDSTLTWIRPSVVQRYYFRGNVFYTEWTNTLTGEKTWRSVNTEFNILNRFVLNFSYDNSVYQKVR